MKNKMIPYTEPLPSFIVSFIGLPDMQYRDETVQATCSCKAIEIAQARLQDVYKTKERFSVILCESSEVVELRKLLKS